LKSASLNFLEPSGPVQACNGIALPLSVYISTAYLIFFPFAQGHTRSSAACLKLPSYQIPNLDHNIPFHSYYIPLDKTSLCTLLSTRFMF
jgi:hypothetical protein